MGKLLLFSGALLTFAVCLSVDRIFMSDPCPNLPDSSPGWWGRGKKPPQKRGGEKQQKDQSLKPFTVNVPQEQIADLKSRLERARFNEALESGSFQYGFQEGAMRGIVDHLRSKYDWGKHEKVINSYDNFKTNIEGIDVHFLHAAPKEKDVKAKPLLMLHGWPGSFWEFHRILPMLTDPVSHGGSPEDTFTVYCPSLPGFGFSEAPHQPGFDTTDAARVFVELMRRAGHEQFYVQGGDWGAIIANNMAQLFPEHVLGIHVNMVVSPTRDARVFLHKMAASVLPSVFLKEADRARFKPITAIFGDMLKETGYLHIQATKPDTLAWALNDSPIGLTAYILEKFSTWTNLANRDSQDGGLASSYDLDDLLTNVMIYWYSGTIGSSMRFYKETFTSETYSALESCPVNVPSGLANFPNELYHEAETFAAYRFSNIVQYHDMPQGGHFAAFEQPTYLVEDFRTFIQKVENMPV